jgi:hypothetical protein
MTDDRTFFSRVAEVLMEEYDLPERWHYLSFADDERGGFQGAIVVWAHGATDALIKVNAQGQNPHGEVWCVPIPEDKIPEARFRNRLLTTRAEIEEMWGEPCKTQREWDEEEPIQ